MARSILGHMRHSLIALVCTAALIAPATAVASSEAVVHNPFTGSSYARPHTFTLAQDGSVGVVRLHWSGWGSQTAVGRGDSYYRLWPKFKFKTVKGAKITLSHLVKCNGVRYYSHAVVRVKSEYNEQAARYHTQRLSGLLPAGCR